jgi:hypothetical protein
VRSFETMSSADKGVGNWSKNVFDKAFNKAKMVALAQSRAAEISSLRQNLVQACAFFGVRSTVERLPL